MPASARQEPHCSTPQPHRIARDGVSDRADKALCRAYTFADLTAYSFRERLLIRAAGLVFYLLINLIGRTVRFQIEGGQHWEAITGKGQLPIYTFWHNKIFIGTYFFRQRGIVVMTSQSFDGEYIARFIQRFGYGAARGSSTRGGTGAFIEMARCVRQGCPAGFSIDGPKGPRYVAKMGAVLLAKKTGQPVLPFTLTCRKFWQAHRSWDKFQVPKPFTRVLVSIAEPIYVPANANDDALETKRDELQQALDELTEHGEAWRQHDASSSSGSEQLSRGNSI